MNFTTRLSLTTAALVIYARRQQRTPVHTSLLERFRRLRLNAFALTIMAVSTCTTGSAVADPTVDVVASVRGGAVVEYNSYYDSTHHLVVNAWMDSSGAAHGTIHWDSRYGIYDGNPGPYKVFRDIEVTHYVDLSTEDGQGAYLEGIAYEEGYYNPVWIVIAKTRGEQFYQFYGGHGTPMGYYEFYGSIYRGFGNATGSFEFE